jgi:hypothetical protein
MEGLMRTALIPQIPSRRAVPFEAVCRDHSKFQAAKPRSSPITHSFGCTSTRLTKALPSRIRLSISIREYNVGFTGYLPGREFNETREA